MILIMGYSAWVKVIEKRRKSPHNVGGGVVTPFDFFQYGVLLYDIKILPIRFLQYFLLSHVDQKFFLIIFREAVVLHKNCTEDLNWVGLYGAL